MGFAFSLEMKGAERGEMGKMGMEINFDDDGNRIQLYVSAGDSV